MHKTEHRLLHLEFMESWIDVEKPERPVKAIMVVDRDTAQYHT